MTRAPRARIAFAAIVLALIGCSDPSLKIVFAIEDDALAAAVDRVTVEMFVPGELGFDCSALAFGLVTAPPVIQIELGRELGTIPRTGTKLFVVRGYQEGGGEPTVAGCAEVETIEEREELRIVAEPATLVVVEGGSYGLTEDRTADFNRWRVEIQDLLSRPQPQVQVRWEAFGAGMLEPITGEATALASDERGPTITLAEHPAPGPLRMTVRSRWGLFPSTALSFVPPRETRFSLAGARADFAIVGAPPNRRLISVVQTSTSSSEVSVFGVDDEGPSERSSEIIAGTWIAGQTGAETFLLSRGEVQPVSIEDERVRFGAPRVFPLAAEPLRTIDLSGCGPSVDLRGAVALAGGAQQIFDGRFEVVSLAGGEDIGTIEASGCVPTRDGPEVRVLWSIDEERHLSLLAEEGVQPLPLDPRIVSLAFGGRWTDAANVAISTSVVDRTTEIALRPELTLSDGLLFESPETLLGAAAAMDAADVDDNGSLDLVVLTRIDSSRHAVYLIVTGQNQASAGAGLLLEGSFAEPWLAVVAFEERGAPVIVVGDRSVADRGLFFFQMAR